MLDLTKLGISPGPWWEVRKDNNGDVFEVGGLYATTQFNKSDGVYSPIISVSEADARLVAASYEMLSDKIDDTIALEPFFDGDQDNPVVRIVERNIEFLEKLLDLPWAEVKQRLGV